MNYLLRLYLAISLLTTEREPSVAEFVFVSPALVEVGQAADILAPWEGLSSTRHQACLKEMRDNLKELSDAPSSDCCYLFAGYSRESVKLCLEFNNKYKDHLERKLLLYPHSTSLRKALRDAQELYDAWDALDDTQRRYSFYSRRNALRRLLTILGPEAFYKGEMPDPLPRWALEAIR